MMCVITGISRVESLLNLFGVFLLFLLVLAAAYFTSRWLGKTNLLQQNNKNIQIIETFRLSQTKYIQIVKIGTKYMALGITKEHIEVIGEWKEEELNLSQVNSSKAETAISFSEVFAKIRNHKNK